MKVLKFAGTAGVAAAGFLAGHSAGYLLAIPSDHERSIALEATGHGYLPAAWTFAVGLAAASLAVAIALGWAEGRGRTTRSHRRLWPAALIQAAAFVVLELSERAVSGGHSAGAGAVALGVPVQLAFGALAALVFRGFVALGGMLASIGSGPLPQIGVLTGFSEAPSLLPRDFRRAGGASPRAPPLLI